MSDPNRPSSNGDSKSINQSAASWGAGIARWREAYKTHRSRKHERHAQRRDYSDLFLREDSLDKTEQTEYDRPLLSVHAKSGMAPRAKVLGHSGPSSHEAIGSLQNSRSSLIGQALLDSVSRQASLFKDWVMRQAHDLSY